jgi:hypothetical protein
MDKTKLKVLREIGYTFPKTCGMCHSSQFRTVSPWGTCANHTYKHEKHTGQDRQLSIHILGGCDDFKPRPDAEEMLEGFAQLLPWSLP